MFLALDTETTGLGYWDTAFCVSYAWRDSDGELHSTVLYLDDINAKDLLHMKMDEAEGLVFHNAKFDLQKLGLAGIELPMHIWTFEIHDTEAMSHLLDEQQPKALKRLAKEVLGLETDEEAELRLARRKLKLRKKDGYQALPREVLEPYARKDAEFTLLLFEHFYPQIQADDQLRRLYAEEQELAQVLMKMEAAGLAVDMEYVNEETKRLAAKILETDLEIRDMVGDEDFNPGSWQQIQAAFKDRGITIESTSKAVLSAVEDPLAERILSLRHNTKMFATYFKALQAEVGEDHILHPNFKQWGTRGRRFSAGGVDG